MPDNINVPPGPPQEQNSPPNVPKIANTTKPRKKHKSTLNKDKARAYLKEYVTNGFNKTGALHAINKNRATYKSNNVNAGRFHDSAIVSESIKKELNIDHITQEYIISGIEREIKVALKAGDRLRAWELLGKFKQVFNDAPTVTTNIYNTNDIKDLERIQSNRVKV